jgi:lysyl-tRNA synthetase class 2
VSAKDNTVYESQFEEDLYNLRREKLKQIAALGQATYPNSYAATLTIPELRARYDAITAEQFSADLESGKKIEVAISGRIMAIRVQGKAGFAQLQQAGQRMQLYVRKDDVGESGFALYKLLDLGDHVGARGYLMRTRTGELTVHVTELTFLTKAMLALPDKFHGLEDTELRYRQRSLDLIVNPEVREVFVKRAAILRSLRSFFDARGYLEVETPMMHPVVGGAAARPFETHHNALDLDLKLRIAPELYLKRLVVGGMDRVYEINRNFRNEGIDTSHNPEFTMLEFYQAYSNYEDLMDLTPKLIAHVAQEVNGTTKTTFNDVEIDLAPENWTKLSMRDAIIQFWPEEATPPKLEFFSNRSELARCFREASKSMSLVRAAIGDTQDAVWIDDTVPSTPDGRKRCRKADLEVAFEGLAHMIEKDGSNVHFGKIIATVFEALAEPHLIQPTIIYDYPFAVSPLSKQKPEEPDWVERFEFYVGGFELGNAFSELNDPVDQRARFAAQLAERDRGDEEAMPMDEDYVRALGYGLPPTAGEGIGIDRLTMILTGTQSIRDVILFPLLRPHTPNKTPTE